MNEFSWRTWIPTTLINLGMFSMLEKNAFFPLLAAHCVRSVFENSRKQQCHLVYNFRWQTSWVCPQSHQQEQLKDCTSWSHLMALLHSLQRHHQLPVPSWQSISLDTPGWVGSLWMGLRHWLTPVPEEQKSIRVKNHSHINSNSGSIFLLTSLLSTQLIHLLVGDLCSSGIQFTFFFFASFKLWPLRKICKHLSKILIPEQWGI